MRPKAVGNPLTRAAARYQLAQQSRRPKAKPRSAFTSEYVEQQAHERANRFGHKLVLPPAGIYVVTWAQNDTPVHEDFLRALQQYCAARRAELVVLPGRYKNPTSRQSADASNPIWDERVRPYLFAGRALINKHVMLIGDAKVQPSASNPLGGFDTLTGRASGIIGHPQLALRTIATPASELPKLMATTGAVTRENYVDSRAGKLGEFHHTFGAAVIEVHGEIFHLRHLNALADGSFTDLEWRYSADGIERAPRALAVVLGDVHVGATDERVVEATFSKGGIIPTLNPEEIIFHDLFDGTSVNYHDLREPFVQLAKQAAGVHKVRQEIEAACAFVKQYTPPDTRAVVVASNHDDFLRKWINSTDWRSLGDLDNAKLYAETLLEMLQHTERMGEPPSPFVLWASKLMPRTVMLAVDESLMRANVELGLHGDMGPNGSRGSAKNLSKIGTKAIVGHSHAPCIVGGLYQVGTSSKLRLGYNRGPSSWLNSHCAVHADGKRQLLHVIGGAWRAA